MAKVCSGCGGATFYVMETSHRQIFVDGDGKVVDADEYVQDDIEYPMTCTTCEKSHGIHDTVTEAFFHEVIAIHAKAKPDAETMTSEQRSLMWESEFTFMEGEYKEMHIIKNKAEQRFGIVEFDEVYGLLRSDKKVLIVHMDGTHVLNFSLNSYSKEEQDVH